jgi:NitT/TauT family transport system substrate-binding protein
LKLNFVKRFAVPAALALVVTAAGGTSAAPDTTPPGSSAPPGTPNAPEELIPINVATTFAFGYLPTYVASEEGFFEAHGLDATITTVPDAIMSVGRQFDFVGSVSGQVIPFASAGNEIVFFAGTEGLSADVQTTALVTGDPEVQEVTDLIGKRVGIVSLGGANATILAYMMAEAGLDIEDVEMVVIPFDAMADQLRAGQVDVVNPATGFWEPLIDEGYRSIASLPQDGLILAGAELPIAFAGYVATKEFAEANPDVMDAFQAANDDAVEWIMANPAGAYDYLAEWTGREREGLEDSVAMPYWHTDITPADLEPWIPIFESASLLPSPVDPEALVWES